MYLAENHRTAGEKTMVEEEFLLVKNTNGRSMHMFMTRTKTKALAMLLVLAMVIAIVPVAASANYTPTTINTVQTGFGDPNKPATAPECYISLTYDSDSGKYNASYSDSIATSYFPGEVALYAAPGTGFSGTLTLVASNSSIWFETYDQYGVSTTHSSITYASNSNWNRDNNQYELSYLFATKMTAVGDVYVKNGSGENATTLFTIHFPGPLPYTMPGVTTTPTALNGYLPVGQFATGTGWGSPFTNSNATAGINAASTITRKIVGSYSATGISLGSPGGYAEYNMVVNNFDTNGNKIQRPYGVDFIVYGNAFNGNPEAGSVKVYGIENKDEAEYQWYELAGSLYYSDVTLRDVTVTYKKVTSTDTTFTTKGIWYRIDDASNTEITGWTKFNQTVKNGVQQDTTVAWWPEASEGYLGTNGVYGNVDDVVVDTTANTIAYKHVTVVRDTDTNGDYAFGYFDVTPNGSSYGTAINPYVTYVNGTTGGDGYDLDWAVDNNGNPVELASIAKIRVYTSAGMKTNGSKTFTVPAIFGETSAELCGIYATSGSASASMAKATQATFVVSDPDNTSESHTTSVTLSADSGATATGLSDVLSYASSYGATTASVTVSAASGAIVYVNEEKLTETGTGTYTGTINITSFVGGFRVVVQKSDACPYIAVIK